MRLRTTLALALLGLLWGSAWLVPHTTVRPFAAAALRCLTAAAVLGSVVLVRRTRLPGGRTVGVHLLLGFTFVAFPYALLQWAQSRLSFGVHAVGFACLPLIVALLSPLFAQGREQSRIDEVPRRAFYAMIAGIAGMTLLTAAALSPSPEQIGAIAMLLLAVVSTAFSILLASSEFGAQATAASPHPHADVWMSAALQLATAGFLLLLLSLSLEPGQGWHWPLPSLAETLLLIGAGNVAGFPLYYWLLRQLPPYPVATVFWLQPLVAAAEAASLLGEKPDWRMLMGALTVIASLLVVLRARDEDDSPLTLR